MHECNLCAMQNTLLGFVLTKGSLYSELDALCDVINTFPSTSDFRK